MRVVGVSLVRDARALDFPIVETIRSILPLTDQVLVNVGAGTDGTAEYLRSAIADPRITTVERDWDDSVGGTMLARETQAMLDLARGDWVVYVQADEVLHEAGIEPLRDAMTRSHGDSRVEGLAVRFVHHYGHPDTVATARHWYRREVRVVRIGAGISSHHEAQGFRVGPARRRVRVRPVAADYHHYGWSRPVQALAAKGRADHAIYGRPQPPPGPTTLPWEYGLRPASGHPAVMRQWIAARAGTFAPIGPPRWNPRQLRLAASDLVERLTGKRLWEYRNYEVV